MSPSSQAQEQTQEQDDDLILEQIEIGPMQNFTYIVGSKSTREVAIVDPAWDIDALLARIDEQGYTLTAALATHYHPDHVGGNFGRKNVPGLAELMAKRPVKVYSHKLETAGVKKVTELSDSDFKSVESGDKLRLGNVEVEFLHTPGHTPGSQCFRIGNTLVSGDTLFIQGCGRVDLPGSNSDDMFRSLEKLRSLPDNTLLLPGHNYAHVPNATLGETRKFNTQLNITEIDLWHQLMGEPHAH